jgi:hypothetical protein
MDKTAALYIFLGVLIGTIGGGAIGAVRGNMLGGMQVGALAGVFVSWILSSAAFQK